MFGTMGITELILILVIVLIIFGAGKLPQIGEGMGKALKGFKKEVHEIPGPVEEEVPPAPAAAPPPVQADEGGRQSGNQAAPATAAGPSSNVPYTPGPELTPGTTASMIYGAGPQAYQPPAPKSAPAVAPSQPVAGRTAPPESSPTYTAPPSMEDRMTSPTPMTQASYPSLPPQARTKPGVKRPSSVVNKAAVARVQAKQQAMKEAAAKGSVSPQDLQGVGEGLGDVVRTFRQAASDVRGAVEPEVRTLRAEMDSAQKEIEQSVEAAKQEPAIREDRQQSSS